MPIILVCAEGPNENLKDFKTMDLVVDMMLVSTHPACNAIAETISKMCTVVHQIPMNSLDAQGPDESIEDVRRRIVCVVESVRQIKMGTAIIVSHIGVFNSNTETTMDGEWDLINL